MADMPKINKIKSSKTGVVYEFEDINLKQRVEELENRPETPIYDDSALKQRIESLENTQHFSGNYNDLTNKPVLPQPYDDTDLKNRVKTLEEKPEAPTYDDSAVKERLEALENKPETPAYDDTQVKKDIENIKTAFTETSGSLYMHVVKVQNGGFFITKIQNSSPEPIDSLFKLCKELLRLGGADSKNYTWKQIVSQPTWGAIGCLFGMGSSSSYGGGYRGSHVYIFLNANFDGMDYNVNAACYYMPTDSELRYDFSITITSDGEENGTVTDTVVPL